MAEPGKSYWLLLEKSDENRVSAGIDSYGDVTGHYYNYDNLVPNCRQLKSGDFIIIRKNQTIHGCGFVGDITITEGMTKEHRRCPVSHCSSTDIRPRKVKTPRWKCGPCGHEFSEPKRTTAVVEVHSASIVGYRAFDTRPPVREIKACAQGVSNGVKSQLSMLRLDPVKLEGLVFDFPVSLM